MARLLIAFALACIAISGVSIGAEPAPSSEYSTGIARADDSVHATAENAIFTQAEEATLYTLSMLVCVANATRPCELHEQIVGGLGAHPGTAFMQAQPFVARWLQTHPGYVVRRWRLLPGRGA